MLLYTESERVRILTGCGITLEQVIEYKTLTFSGYDSEWKRKTTEKLKEISCPTIIILRVLNGEYDHNKMKLYSHLRLFERETLLNKIWQIIK